MKLRTKTKVAWVTGASKGIGRAIALQLEREGWIIAASARSQEDLISLAKEATLNNIYLFPLDITNKLKTKTTIKNVEKQLGEINLAILNAGTYKPDSADTFSASSFRLLVEINLMGTVYGLEHILTRFLKRKSGQIAIVSSIAGYRGLPNSIAYGATKAALINMCEALKPELDENNIYLSVINPGFVRTPLTDKNEFYMPFLICSDTAAKYIIDGLKKHRFEISFPRRFSIIMKFLRTLPYSIYFSITKRLLK